MTSSVEFVPRPVEPLSSHDAVMWHLESVSPMHTLKVAVVDPARRGSPLTLSDVKRAIEANLDRYPRARQRVVPDPGRRGRLAWAEDPGFDLVRHLDAQTVPAPGGRHEFDACLGELAERRLPLDRPLWHASLLDGLEGGRQAIVLRIHHAVTDGSGAAAAFEGFTTAEPRGGTRSDPQPPSTAATTAAAVRGRIAALSREVRTTVADSRAGKEFRARAEHLPPPGFVAYRDTFLIGSLGTRRQCATGSLPLADFRAVGKSTGTTVNGVLHAVLAGALRTERLRRGEDPTRPLIAAFGIALDDPEAPRRWWGNNITPTYVALYTGEEDPLERLRRTAGSAREGVELCRVAGGNLASRLAMHAPRFPSVFIRAFKDRITSPAHLVTANVRGPATSRWLGDCEVVEFYSLVSLQPPLAVNITTYSYAGEMRVGVMTIPDEFDDPRSVVDGMADSLAELVAATAVRPASG